MEKVELWKADDGSLHVHASDACMADARKLFRDKVDEFTYQGQFAWDDFLAEAKKNPKLREAFKILSEQ